MNSTSVTRTRFRLGVKPVLWILLASLASPAAAGAQGSVDPEHGYIAVARLLRGAGSVKRVLVIGAHPDDEDTALLTVLERGLGADAAYLALNRGEGGQNLIGPELGVGLGLIRTEELLSARRLDGADQFFTRAYDFGYSKSAEETLLFWPRDSLLADVVSVIRRFRPQVIVSIFTGTRRDGHGQHQVAGLMVREAFEAAGDPERFPGQVEAGLEPWTPLKLYRSTRRSSDDATLTVETGTLDLLYGRSYHQIAMASRSQHRSQDMGTIEALGPRRTSVALLESRVAARAEPESSIFDGVDTTLAGLLPGTSDRENRAAVAELLVAYEASLRSGREQLGRGAPPGVVSHLGRALSTLREAIELSGRLGPEARDLRASLSRDEIKLEAAVAEAAGVIVGAFSTDDLIIPGQSFLVDVQVWNGGSEAVDLKSISLRTPAEWRVEPRGDEAGTVAPGTLARFEFNLTAPPNAEPTRLYSGTPKSFTASRTRRVARFEGRWQSFPPSA